MKRKELKSKARKALQEVVDMVSESEIVPPYKLNGYKVETLILETMGLIKKM